MGSPFVSTAWRLLQRCVVAGLRAMAWLLLALAWLWSCFAIGLFRPLPGGATISLALLWVCLTVGVFWRLPLTRALGYVSIGIVFIWAVWWLQPARNDRNVIGDESDLIGLRANIRQHPVYLYPVKASKDQVRQLFLSLLGRAEHLRTSPEFYNTVANSCSSNLLWHLNQVRHEPVGWNWRVLLPGYSDELAFDLGLIDCEGSLEQARTRCCLEGRTTPWTTGQPWSRQIREPTSASATP